MKCKHCRFFRKDIPEIEAGGEFLGDCRISAPFHIDESPKAEWPSVWSDDWCGDFEVIDGLGQL